MSLETPEKIRSLQRKLILATRYRTAYHKYLSELTYLLFLKNADETRPCRQLRRVCQATPDQKSCSAFVTVVSLGIPKSLFL